mgnify:CR=1 FL=1
MSDKYNSVFAKFVKWVNLIPADHVFGITTGPETTRYSAHASEVTDRMRRHEDTHKAQYKEYGSRIKFWVAYFKMNIKYGYANNPFEVAARLAENG